MARGLASAAFLGSYRDSFGPWGQLTLVTSCRLTAHHISLNPSMIRGLQCPHLVHSKGAQDVLGSRPDARLGEAERGSPC